jgi:hypothetical protein
LERNAMDNYSADFMNWFQQVPQPPPNYFNWAAGIQDWLRRAYQSAPQIGAAPSDPGADQSASDDTQRAAVAAAAEAAAAKLRRTDQRGIAYGQQPDVRAWRDWEAQLVASAVAP